MKEYGKQREADSRTGGNTRQLEEDDNLEGHSFQEDLLCNTRH